MEVEEKEHEEPEKRLAGQQEELYNVVFASNRVEGRLPCYSWMWGKPDCQSR